MEFLDLPHDVIVQQLRHMPLGDLLRTCQTNHEIAKICQGQLLWTYRLADRFGITDTTGIHDPRSYFFDLLDKEALLNWILQNVSEGLFNELWSNSGGEIGVDTYEEFLEAQRQIVNRLTRPELDAMKILRASIPRSAFYAPGEWGPGTLTGFFFDPSTNGIVYI